MPPDLTYLPEGYRSAPPAGGKRVAGYSASSGWLAHLCKRFPDTWFAAITGAFPQSLPDDRFLALTENHNLCIFRKFEIVRDDEDLQQAIGRTVCDEVFRLMGWNIDQATEIPISKRDREPDDVSNIIRSDFGTAAGVHANEMILVPSES